MYKSDIIVLKHAKIKVLFTLVISSWNAASDKQSNRFSNFPVIFLLKGTGQVELCNREKCSGNYKNSSAVSKSFNISDLTSSGRGADGPALE